MTDPTPEMVARRKLAADIADRQWSTRSSHWFATFEGALAAIIETSERAAKMLDYEIVEIFEDSPESDKICNAVVREIAQWLGAYDHIKPENG